MQHECRITVIDKKCFKDFQEQYLADPKSGPCPFFNVGDEFILKRTPKQDDFYHLMNGKFCGEASTPDYQAENYYLLLDNFFFLLENCSCPIRHFLLQTL